MTKPVNPDDIRATIARHRHPPPVPRSVGDMVEDLAYTPRAVRRLRQALHSVATDGVRLARIEEVNPVVVRKIYKRWLSQIVGWDAATDCVDDPDECFRLVMEYVDELLRNA